MSVKAYGPAPPSVGTETSESAARIRVVRCVRSKGAVRGQEPIPGAAPEGRTSPEGWAPSSGATQRKAGRRGRGPRTGQDDSHGQVGLAGKDVRRGPPGAQSQHLAPPRSARHSQGAQGWGPAGHAIEHRKENWDQGFVGSSVDIRVTGTGIPFRALLVAGRASVTSHMTSLTRQSLSGRTAEAGSGRPRAKT